MSLQTIIRNHGIRSPSTRRARSTIARAAPKILCEGLEARWLMAVHSWDITWIGPTPTSARLESGSLQGQVRVFLNTNPDPNNANFTFNNTTGMDLIRTSLSNFTFIDKVQGDDKPRTDGSNDGIKVELTGGATGGHLRAEGTLWDDDFRVTESTASSTTVAVRAFGVWGNTRAGAGVNNVTIETDENGGATVQVTTVGAGFGDPDLPGLHPNTSLRIDSLGPNDKIHLGGANDASVHATVRTGAGNNEVFLRQDAEADGNTTAVVDFDPNLGGGLGAGNRLQLGNANLTGVNCTATLARVPETGAHAITVNQIYMVHGTVFGVNGDTPATVIIDDVTRLGEARLFQESDLFPTAGTRDPRIFVDAPLTVEKTAATPGNQATTGIVYLGGRMDFADTSAPSTVHKFEVGIRKEENPGPFDLLQWVHSRGVVNVNSGTPAGADLTVQVDSRVATMNIPGNGEFTFQPRAVGFPQVDPRSFLFKTLFMGSTPTGKFDLNDNSMVVDYTGTSPYDYLRQLMSSAHAAGAWTGNGLGSGTAASATVNLNDGIGYAEATDLFTIPPEPPNPNPTFLGRELDNSTMVLIRYTLYGDTNLDGRVNLVDFNELAANFGTGTRWDQGDSWYDGNVNLQDFNRLAANFGLSINPGEGEGGGEGFGPGGGGEPHYTYDELLAMLIELNPEDF